MNLDITGRNVNVTPALREYTLERLAKLERLVDGPIEAHMVLRIDKHRHWAEIQLSSNGVTLSSAEETGDFYASIAQVTDKIERQLLKYKDKVRDRKPRRGGREAAGPGAPGVDADEVDARAEDGDPRIVLSRRYRIKPMSPEDALLELEASTEDLIVFREPANYRINVLYRQKDGNFALIDPDF